MSLMDKATDKAKADRKAEAERRTAAVQARIAKVEQLTSEHLGLPVLYSGTKEIAERQWRGSAYGYGAPRKSLPVLEKREIFTVNNEVEMTHELSSYNSFFTNDGRVTELVMPCAKKCGRLVRARTVHVYKDTGEQAIVKAIAEWLKRPAQCSFCEATAEASTCPTCHRPLGEARYEH